MLSSLARRLMPAACAGVLLASIGAFSAAVAQTAPTPSPPRRDPLNASEAVPPVQHRSAVADYKRHAEQPVGSWREANDTVAKVGGWRAYAREARHERHERHEGHGAPTRPAKP